MPKWEPRVETDATGIRIRNIFAVFSHYFFDSPHKMNLSHFAESHAVSAVVATSSPRRLPEIKLPASLHSFHLNVNGNYSVMIFSVPRHHGICCYCCRASSTLLLSSGVGAHFAARVPPSVRFVLKGATRAFPRPRGTKSFSRPSNVLSFVLLYPVVSSNRLLWLRLLFSEG